MADVFPKRLTEIYQCSDGAIFGSESEARKHDRRALVLGAIKRAREEWRIRFEASRAMGKAGGPRMSNNDMDVLILEELELAGVLD